MVVNAGGLYGDRVENICRPSKFTYDINFVHLLLSDLKHKSLTRWVTVLGK